MASHLFQLIRAHQWYKNIVVFLAIFFSGNLLEGSELYRVFWALGAFCFISSANYIINDLVDIAQDKLHPEKKFRPLAAGKVQKLPAFLLACVLLIIGLLMAYVLGKPFFYAAFALFLLTQMYSFFLKNLVFADILTIGVLFVLRAMAGALAINVKISPWLILCPFFLSLFLSVGKRHAEVHQLKDKAWYARTVLREYDHDLTTSLMTISTTLLVISYALYSFLSEHPNLIYTLPLALFVIFRFYYLINSGSVIARQAEKMVVDIQMLIGVLLWAIVSAVIIYG